MASNEVSPEGSVGYTSDMFDVVEELKRISHEPIKNPAHANRQRMEMYQAISRGRDRTDDWTKKDLLHVFNSSYKEGTGLPFKPDAHARQLGYRHRRKINERTHRGLGQLQEWSNQRIDDKVNAATERALGGQITALERQLQGASGAEKRELQKKLEQSKKMRTDLRQKGELGVGADPTVGYKYRKAHGRFKKGTIHTEQPAEAYFAMVGETGHQDMAALGFLSGAAADGKWILVSDGEDCGWTSHDDPDLANGMIIPPEEAMKHPRAHPNCIRAFEILDGPPTTKKGRESLKKLLGVTNKKEVQKIAKAGALLGKAANLVRETGRSKLVASVVRNIMADTQINLPSPMQVALARWTGNYARKESTVLKRRGMDPRSSNMDLFRRDFFNDMDIRLLDEDFMNLSRMGQVNITQDQARILGTRTRVTKGELIDRMEDYADYARHQRNSHMSLAQNLLEQQVESAVRMELYGEAAIRYSLTSKRTGNKVAQWKRAIHVARDTIERSPYDGGLEAIKLAATGIGRTPWLSVGQGPWRFTNGITAQGRREIAETLYKRVIGQRAYSQFEIDYARRMGLELTSRNINAQDIVRAMTPRLSFLPGKPFHASVSLQNGRLKPVVRLYPGNTYLQQLRLEASLRSGTMEDIVKRLLAEPGITPANLRQVLTELNDGSIFAIDAFRNGPVRGSIRWHGGQFESMAIKMRPEQDWLRHNFRLYPKTGRSGITSLQAESEFFILPRLNGGAMLTKADEARALLMGMYQWRGNLMEVARALGISYEDLQRFMRDLEIRLGESFQKFLTDSANYSKSIQAGGGVRGIRSIADLQAIANQYKLVSSRSAIAPYVEGRAINLANYVDAQLMNPGLAHASLRRDIEVFIRTWEAEFSTPAPRFVMGTGAMNEPMVHSAAQGVVMISPSAARNWVAMGRMRAADLGGIRNRAVSASWNPPGTEATVSALFHEGMHHTVARMGPWNYARTWSEIFNSRGWAVKPPRVTPSMSRNDSRNAILRWMREPEVARQIRHEVGGQSLLGPDEFLAEIFTQAMTANEPGRMAVALRTLLQGMDIL